MHNIKFLYSNKIDKKKWDTCVVNSVNGNVYGLSWYLDIVSNNWGGFLYGDYELVFPVVYKKFLFYKKIYHPFFCQQLGPFSGNIDFLHDKVLLLNLVKIISDKYNTFDFSINHSISTLFQSILLKNQFQIEITHRINLELDLNQSYENLELNYSNQHKRTLKNNINHYTWDIGHTYSKESSLINEFVVLHKKHIALKAGVNKFHYQVMRRLIELCVSKNIGFFIGLRNQDSELLACAFFVSFLHRDILLFNVSKKSIKLNLMTFILDKYIYMNAETEKVLDFEGSNIVGVKRFYQGFGSIEKNYIHINK